MDKTLAIKYVGYAKYFLQYLNGQKHLITVEQNKGFKKIWINKAKKFY